MMTYILAEVLRVLGLLSEQHIGLHTTSKRATLDQNLLDEICWGGYL